MSQASLCEAFFLNQKPGSMWMAGFLFGFSFDSIGMEAVFARRNLRLLLFELVRDFGGDSLNSADGRLIVFRNLQPYVRYIALNFALSKVWFIVSKNAVKSDSSTLNAFMSIATDSSLIPFGYWSGMTLLTPDFKN